MCSPRPRLDRNVPEKPKFFIYDVRLKTTGCRTSGRIVSSCSLGNLFPLSNTHGNTGTIRLDALMRSPVHGVSSLAIGDLKQW